MAEQNTDAGEREFEATPQRREQARRDGDTLQSKELSGFAVLLGAACAAVVFDLLAGPGIFRSLSIFLERADSIVIDLFQADGSGTRSLLWELVRALAPIFLIPMVFIVAAALAARTLSFSAKRIKFDLKKISPIHNIKNKYGAKGLTDYIKDFCKFMFACFICVFFLYAVPKNSFAGGHVGEAGLYGFTVDKISALVLAFVAFQFALAMMDLPLQNYLLSKRIKMSREEIKKDMKQSEGDPHLKQFRRDKASKISRGQMLKEVKGATVVMVNPTHYAVALTWQEEGDRAPVCVAKGADHLAARIREVAEANGVPIYSDPPTTRSIYRLIDIDAEIRPEHFAAVAAAIRYVRSIVG